MTDYVTMPRSVFESYYGPPPSVDGPQYVCGFLHWGQEVLLVRKTRPPWQHGLLNGIGGLIEPGESPRDAMAREFAEEVGVPVGDWPTEPLCTEIGPDYVVHFFATRAPGIEQRPATPEQNDVGEQLIWVPRDCYGWKVVGNLRWLIPLSLDWRAPRATVLASERDIKERPSW